VGDFGVGWTLNVKNVRLQKSRSLGKSWNSQFNPGSGYYCIDPLNARQITVTLANNQVFEFQSVFSPSCQYGLPIETVGLTFTNLPGTHGSLAIDGDNQADVDGYLGTIDLVDFADFSIFNPTRFKITTPEGVKYVIDEVAGLQSMGDTNGNTLLINTTGVLWTNVLAGGPALGISFMRDSAGRITNIVDTSSHSLAYQYDSNGDLRQFVTRENQTNSFSYTNNHYLFAYTDPRGIQALRNEYDDAGRLVREIDANNKTNYFAHDLSNNREIITDRLGNVTVHEYDLDGNVVRTTDALTNITTYTYDAEDNQLTKGDALNNTNFLTYDNLDNKLTEADPLGNTNSYTYDSFRNPLSQTDPRHDSSTNIYDPSSGNLTAQRDRLGNYTRFTYDGQGNILTISNALGHLTTNRYDQFAHLTNVSVWDAAQLKVLNSTVYSYDLNGNQTAKITSRTTPSGLQWLTNQYFYDAENRLTNTTFPDGTYAQTIYNGIGKPAIEFDQLRRQTQHFYDANGNLTNTTFPDLTFEFFGYDAENRKIFWQDGAGYVTRFTNDALGRLVTVLNSDLTTSNIVYDAIGRVAVTVDERGNTNSFGYDPHCGCPNRQLTVTNGLGQVTQYSYDANGNVQTMLDARTNLTTYVYDAEDRRTQMIFADNSSQFTLYDPLGRRIAEVDQENRTNRFGYDALNRLTSVTNAIGGVTRYDYNEVGSLVAQTDANTHATSFEYDSLGRRTKRMLPGSQVETFGYDTIGNMIRHTNFNGVVITNAFDAMNRVTYLASTNGYQVSWTYTATGKRQAMTDPSGSYAYVYDARYRLRTNATPQGTLYYGYDAVGNLTNVTSSTPGGTSVSYQYDPLNRVTNVIDARLTGSQSTGYSFDPVGNLRGYFCPNGVTNLYEYDSLNRLTNLTWKYGASARAQFAYSVSPSGHRTNLAETVNSVGRSFARRYDPLYRLTNETVSGASPTGSVGYGLDAVANRTNRNSTLTGVTNQTFSYSLGDRLNSDGYDGDGSTTNSRGNSYQYDVEDRLIGLNSGAATIFYNGDGERVKKIAGGVTTFYLVDSLNPSGYAQALEELTVSGGATNLARAYTYGLGLISQRQPGVSTNFYGLDGHGSVRFLSGLNGAVTDTYAYDGYGIPLASSGSTANNYLYTGQQFDPDFGLYYLRARYLDPNSCRFWTMDSFEGAQTDPLSLHKYLYAEDDPVNGIDPSGYFTLSELMTAMGVDKISEAAKGISANKARQKSVKTLACVFGVESIKRYMDYEFTEMHHPIPLSMGGPDKNLIPLPVNTHRMFHFVLNILIKDKIPGFSNYTPGVKWADKLIDKAEKKVLLALLKTAARYVDKQCDYPKSMSLVSFIQKNEKEWLK